MIEFLLNASTEINKNDEKGILAKMDLLNNTDSKLRNEAFEVVDDLAATSDTIVRLLGTRIHAPLGLSWYEFFFCAPTERCVDP